MRRSLLVAALATLPLMSTAAEPPAPDLATATPQAATTPKFTPEQLARIRQALVAQIAVRDAGEGAMRAPTPAEAQALAAPSGGPAGKAYALPGGGVAYRPDISDASLLTAVRGESGKIVLGHDPSAKPALQSNAKGAAHAH